MHLNYVHNLKLLYIMFMFFFITKIKVKYCTFSSKNIHVQEVFFLSFYIYIYTLKNMWNVSP